MIWNEVIYPGDGLPILEQDRLLAAFPGLRLLTFEEMVRLWIMSDRPGVVFSASPPSDDPRGLFELGWSKQHLDDAVIRIARSMLRENFDIVYGGIPEVGFTKSLLEESGAIVVEPRFISIVGYPYSQDLSFDKLADDFGICRYVRVPPPMQLVRHDKTVQITDAALTSVALFETRKAMICGNCFDVDGIAVSKRIATIIMAGKALGFKGAAPGLAEGIRA